MWWKSSCSCKQRHVGNGIQSCNIHSQWLWQKKFITAVFVVGTTVPSWLIHKVGREEEKNSITSSIYYCEGWELCLSMKVPGETEHWALTSVGCSLIGFFSVVENWSRSSAWWEAETKLLLSGSGSCQDTIQSWLIESRGKPARRCALRRTTTALRTLRCYC